MKVRFTRWYNAVLTALLSMLGYGCSLDEPEMYGTPLEYGVPHINYILRGVVTDGAGNPIQGIETKFYGDLNGGDPTKTDTNGNYQIQAMTYPGLKGCKLIVNDIDGEANGGEFLSDTIDVETLPKDEVEKGNGWYQGMYESTANIQMKKK